MLRRDPNCKLCRLHATADYVCLLGQGPERSRVMVVGEAPGKREDDSGKPFVGKAGMLLEEVLGEYGFSRSEIFITNAVSCRPPDNRTPSKGEIKACKAWLDYQMKMVRPKFVLLLGNVPLQSVTGKAGITKRRGHPFEKDGVIYLPTFHPAFILRDPDQSHLFERDVQLFRTIVDAGEIPREDKLNHTLVLNRADFDKMLRALRNTVSLDIETNCLYPWQTHNAKGELDPAKITMIGFGTSDGEFSLPMDHPESPWTAEALADMVEEIDRAIRHCILVAHNGKFDFLWMLAHFGVEWYKYFDFDTMLAHYALDENAWHGLKELAQRYCGAPDWDIDKEEKKGNTPLSKLGLYHAHDLYYTRQLRFVLGKLLKRDFEVCRVFKEILMECARLFVEVEFDGVYIDVSKFDDAEEYLRGELAKAEKQLKQYEPPPFVNARGKRVAFNWGSTQQLAKLLFEDFGLDVIEVTKGGNPSCSESVIQRIDHPCAEALLAYRAAKQQLSFFIDGWKPFLHKKYVRGAWHYFLHPSFKLHGTVTGRLSCEHPNLQQVPRDPRIRTLITAPPGWTLIECDLSQIELRIAAELAGEKAMLYAFTHGVDAHWLTAISEIERGGGMKDLVLDTARTWKQDKKIRYAEAIEILLEMGPDVAAEIRVEWKEIRKQAKAINFGYLYGMWWKKFKIYARDNYGVIVTDEQAQASRTNFFQKYPGFPKWHTRQKSFARREGYVRSLSGRKRRLPQAMMFEDTPERREAERQAINSPVQSFANELNLMAAIQLRREYGRDVVRICGTVHDAVLFRVRDDMVIEVTRRMLEIMSFPDMMNDFDIRLTVPIEAEAKVGPWGAGVSLEKYIASTDRRSRRAA